MTDEAARHLGITTPAWYGCWFLALVFLTLAGSEYLYATDYEAADGHPTLADHRQDRTLRRSIMARVTKWGYPRVGKWGCVAVFAVPGCLFLAAGLWLMRRPTAPTRPICTT